MAKVLPAVFEEDFRREAVVWAARVARLTEQQFLVAAAGSTFAAFPEELDFWRLARARVAGHSWDAFMEQVDALGWQDVDLTTFATLEEEEESMEEEEEPKEEPKEGDAEFRRDREYWVSASARMTDVEFGQLVGQVARGGQEGVARGGQVVARGGQGRQEGEGELQCQWCNEQCSSTAALEEHGRQHQQERTFPCESCAQVFQQKHELKQHRLIHTDTKPFACNRCTKGFKSVAQLNLHKDFVHTDSEPIVCPKCGRTFRKNASLEEHMRGHDRPAVLPNTRKVVPVLTSPAVQASRSGLAPRAVFSCSFFLCGQKFASLVSRDSHARDHRNLG